MTLIASAPSNIVINAKDHTLTGNEVLPPVMAFLVDAAKIYPAWKFEVVRLAQRDANGQYAIRVMVHNERGVCTGKIELSNFSYYCTNVEFHNERIHSNAQRGTYKHTSKQDVALKILKRWFTEPSLVEHIDKASEVLTYALSHKAHHIRTTLVQTESTILNLAREYLMSNINTLWDVIPELKNNGHNLTLEKFKDLQTDHEIAKTVNSSSCLTVVIHDGKYVVRRGKGPINVTTSDNLPEEVRRSLGMLKLVEDGQFIRDMGFRAKENLYYVVAPEEQCKTLS
jgi:hypothetical protein